MSDTIDISGLDKAAVLAALYNASHPQGLGFLHYDAAPMTIEDARTFLARNRPLYFDYLKGRVLKVDLSGDTLDPRLYDRDNGAGACAAALVALRGTGDVNPADSQISHALATEEAILQAREMAARPHRSSLAGDVFIVELGAADVADPLNAALDAAQRRESDPD